MKAPGRWVMLEGVGPGIGKSTLAASLAKALAERGDDVDLIVDASIFERPEFTDAAEGFRTKRFTRTRVALPDAYRALVKRHAATGAWIIFDWSAAGMVEDLPWASDLEDLTAHLREVHEIVAPLDPIVLVLEGPLELAMGRAVAERGAEWFARHAASAEEVDPD